MSVRTSGAEIVGAGFLVSEDEIVTCAHVVRDALKLESTPDSVPESGVLVSFPFLAPLEMVPARVIHWDPRKLDGTGDIAILQLNAMPPPMARPVQLTAIETEKMKGCSFATFGFPSRQDLGAFSYGVIKDERPGGTVQLEDTRIPGKPVESGFSGAPVWIELARQVRVVGMVTTADVNVRTTKVAYMIPIHRIAKSWTDLRVLKSALLGRVPSKLQDDIFITPNVTLPNAAAPITDIREIITYLIDDHTPSVVFVLGEFGTGKTQLMVRLWRKLSEVWQKGERVPVPFFYDFTSRHLEALDDYLADARRLLMGDWAGLLSDYEHGLFLLDSFDEIERKSTIFQITALMISLRDHAMKSSVPKVVIACRRNFYDELRLHLDGVQEDKAHLEIGELKVDFWETDQILGYFERSGIRTDSLEDLRRFVARHREVLGRALIASFVAQNIERFRELGARGELTEFRIFDDFFFDQLYAWANRAGVDTIFGEELVFQLEDFIETLAVALLQQGDDNQQFPRRTLVRKLNAFLDRTGLFPTQEALNSSVGSLLEAQHQRDLVYRQITTRSLLELNDDRNSYRFCHQSVWEFVVARLYIRHKLTGGKGSLEEMAYRTLIGSQKWYSTIYGNFIRDQEEVLKRQDATRSWLLD